MKVSTRLEKNKERENSLGTLELFTKETLQRDCLMVKADWSIKTKTMSTKVS